MSGNQTTLKPQANIKWQAAANIGDAWSDVRANTGQSPFLTSPAERKDTDLTPAAKNKGTSKTACKRVQVLLGAVPPCMPKQNWCDNRRSECDCQCNIDVGALTNWLEGNRSAIRGEVKKHKCKHFH
jgi:hypothetical protein